MGGHYTTPEPNMQDAANKKAPTASLSPDGRDLLLDSTRKVINDGTSPLPGTRWVSSRWPLAPLFPSAGCLARRRHLGYVRACVANWECGGILAIVPGRRAVAQRSGAAGDDGKRARDGSSGMGGMGRL